MVNIFRNYECDGLCGVTLSLPANSASALLYPNGDKRPGAFLACGTCQEWFDAVTKDAELIGAANKALSTKKRVRSAHI